VASCTLEQVAKLSYEIEPPMIWRRHRMPTITVQADTAPGLEAATVVKALSSDLAAFKSKLPAGYDVVVGGTVEESAKAEASIFAVFPLMILIMITILMVQLQSFQRLFLVLATAPLALIGVAAALLISRAPMGFVAILGVVSLIGMVIRNSVILIDRIDTEIAAGQHRGTRSSLPRASPAPDPAHGRGRHPRHDTDRAHRVLGSDGLRGDRGIGGGDAAHAGVPARPLRGVVPDRAVGRPLRIVRAKLYTFGNLRRKVTLGQIAQQVRQSLLQAIVLLRLPLLLGGTQMDRFDLVAARA
jgi:hypothetical protein